MPITLNLLHEEQFLQQQRKRDPLKLGFYALGAVASLFFLYYAYRYIESSSVRSELRTKQAQWAKQEPASKAAADREADLNGQLVAADALNKRIEGRFYWAPVVGILIKSVPPNVQITSLNGNNDPKTEKVTIVLEGVVAGDVARIAADQFRTHINEAFGKEYKSAVSVFRSLDDSASSVTLNGKPATTARFTIEVSFSKPTPVAAATPAPERRAKHS